jgi:hypothetical protein
MYAVVLNCFGFGSSEAVRAEDFESLISCAVILKDILEEY